MQPNKKISIDTKDAVEIKMNTHSTIIPFGKSCDGGNMNHSFFYKTFTTLILALMCSSALAEYKTVTKFPRCDFAWAWDDCDGVTDPESLNPVTQHGVDETDLKACEAITDNINEMEKYHVDWRCDFPISSNIPLLSKPQWQEVTGEEQCTARKTSYGSHKPTNETDAQFCKRVSDVPLFGFPYNLDGTEGNEKIYMGIFSNFKCGNTAAQSRFDYWIAEGDGTSLSKRYDYFTDFGGAPVNADIVLFASRVYYVTYLYDEYAIIHNRAHNFVVETWKPPYHGKIDELSRVCEVRPVINKGSEPIRF